MTTGADLLGVLVLISNSTLDYNPYSKMGILSDHGLFSLRASPQTSSTLVFRYTSKRFLVAIKSAVAPGNFKVRSFLLAYCSVRDWISSVIFLYMRRSC